MNSTGAPQPAHSGLVFHAHSTVRAAARRWLVTLSMGFLGLAASVGWQQAQASQVVWSVGVGTPGAVVHVGSHPVPQVIYQPVYQPVHRPVPVQVLVAPPPLWYGPHVDSGRGHHHHHHHHHGHHGHHRHHR
jgi:hypothetical protein